MIRRSFLILAGILGLGVMATFTLESSILRRIIYKIEDLFKSPAPLPLNSERQEAELPAEGETISVEMALNSRCTSDYNENPKKFHWGMFDKKKKLSDEQINKVVGFAKIPRFTERRVEIHSESNVLTFVIDNNASDIQKEWMMVESGMQQQAIGLVCAALGIGMVFRSLRKDGTAISNSEHANIKIKLDVMKPTYDGSFWSSSAPTREKPWLKGNLPDPLRDSDMPLISALGRLQIENRKGKESTDEAVSQLLWAARGRTPHLYKSRPWGMTIPTWGGEQNISSVYLVSDNKLSKYINWHRNRPTHSLRLVNKIDQRLIDEFQQSFYPSTRFIVLGKNEDFARALWEIGFQLLNILLQAHSLNNIYQAVLLDELQRKILDRMGVKDPVAMLAI